MNHPDKLAQAVIDRQARFRHQAYLDHLGRRMLSNRLSQRLVQIGVTVTTTQPTRTQS